MLRPDVPPWFSSCARLLKALQRVRQQYQRLEQERVELEKEKARAETEKARADKAEQLLRRKEKELTSAAMYPEGGNGQSLEVVNQERQAREVAEGRGKEGENAKAEVERKVEIYVAVISIMMCLFLAGLIEFSINYVFKWNHPHSIGLQLAFDALIIFGVIGAFHPKLRVYCWGAGAIAIVSVIIQMLG